MKIHYTSPANEKLSQMLSFESIIKNLDINQLPKVSNAETFPLWKPDGEFSFLHEAAVIAYHDIIFCSWYNCRIYELHDYTPIRGCFSQDGGRTWSIVETIGADPDGKLLYCPPVYAISNDTLYMLMNTMVAPDHIHSLELYRFDKAAKKFRLLRSDPIPFKLNTNACHLDNGKLLLPGRIAKLDGFPVTPAVMISDSGLPEGPWRIVKLQPNGLLPDGSSYVHPELSVIVNGCNITAFCRNDNRQVPILYHSTDYGETWSSPIEHDIFFSNSKIYSGTLANGRNYLIGNILHSDDDRPETRRSHLALFFSEPKSLVFTQGWLLRDGVDEKLGLYPQWSYPCAYEWNHQLYIIYTMVTHPQPPQKRGAMMTIVKL